MWGWIVTAFIVWGVIMFGLAVLGVLDDVADAFRKKG